MIEKIKAVMVGHAVGDALGVPVEFCSREEIADDPVTDMRGFGTYPVPAGAWSDDTSMSVAALDSLANGKIDYDEIMNNFVAWVEEGKYTPTGKSFDIGRTCLQAIRAYLICHNTNECGQVGEYSNGNGSLMRIHPFALYAFAKGMTLGKSLDIIREGSALTHAHPRTIYACGIYAMVLWEILRGADKAKVLTEIENAAVLFDGFYPEESDHFDWATHRKLLAKSEDEISGSGYVVDTLEAALWCLLTTDSYKDCVLKAVNLGEDSDTVAAVAGGLAGALYGIEGIPSEWLDTLIKREYIEEVCERAAETWSK
jgi:ADP-ribosylglycohydrolase